MKTQFRKFISIAVALVMIASLCLSAPLTVSAATVQVTVNNSGNIYTVDANVGEKLAAPAERTNGMYFLGWYSDPACTVEYGVVQENETRKAYAKYPSTFIGFEGKDNYVAGTDYRDEKSGSGVVTDPTNPNNKVFKLHAKDMYAALTMPQYDDNDATRYMLQANHEYTFTYKFMIPGGSSVDALVMRMNKGDLPTGGAGRTPFGDSYYKQSELTALTWYTWSYTLDVGSLSDKRNSPQLVALWNLGKVYDTDYVYFDDVMITDNDSGIEIEVDNTFTSFEGCTVKYDGGFASTTSASVSNEKAHSGSSSLKIAPGGANTYRSYAYNSKNSVLKLDSYTRYTISYWYMATALGGTYTNIYTTLNGNGNVWDQNIQLNKTGIHSSALNEWHKAEFEVITGDCSSQAYLTFGLQTAAAGTVVYIDDVTVTAGEYIGMHDYYCDFNADFSHYGEPGVTNPWPYYSSNVNFNTDNGILYFPTTHSTAPTTSGSTYVQHFAPYDGNSHYQFEANLSYRVTIRYKQTCANKNNTGYFSIGSKANIPASEGIKSLAINHITGTTDWKEYTLDFTTDSIGNQKFLTLTFGSQDGSLVEYEVDYIKVTKGPFINNNGEIYKNNTEVGAEIATPNFDANKYNFIGWYSDPECTKPFGTVRENESRTAYARYNKTIINFSEAEFTQKSTYRDDGEDYGGYESGIVLDPNDATNKVFKLHSPSIWSNFAIPVYDAKSAPSYELIAGVEYTVSVDFKIPSTITSEKLTIRAIVGDRSEGGVGRTPYDNTRINYTISNLEANKWYTYTTTFTATSDVATKPYLFISYIFDDGAVKPSAEVGIASYVYFDNATVYNTAQFEKVTTNNRGTVSTVEMVVGTELPSINSTLDEQVFLGWYADPECTVPFGAVQKDEQRTAYAKYDTVKVTFGNEHKQLNAGETFTVPCYDGVTNALNLKANTTYAMRFIVKPLEGSASGKIAVLGNEFKFDAYDSAKATSWTPASITFTTTDATALQMAVISDGDASVLVDDILVYELDYTPEATVSAGNSTISVTKPVAKNNKQTGTVSINLAEGEQLKVNGITVTYDIYATAFSEPVTTKAILPASENGTDFTYIVPASAKNIAVSAEFIDAAESNISIIAASIREKSAKYSSGIRFRGRVYNNSNIKEVGFLLAPEALIAEAGYTELTLENAEAVKAWKAVSNGVVYEETALYKDYQVILSNIDELLDINIRCVMFVEYNDGTVEYAESKTQSHTGIKSIMSKVYRGITSYYNEEYEDTRDKLLKAQNDGTFSFLSLTDIHIDYVKTVADGEYWYTTPVGGKLPDRPNIQREIAMVIEMANTTDVDCIILGGDLIHGTYGHNSALGELNYLAQVFQKAKVPVISARGNHDNNDYHGKPCALQHIITNEEWTNTLLTPLAKGVETVHDEDDPYSTYYYMDFPEKKTRVITLDAWNYPIITTDGYHSVYSAENGWTMYGDNEQVEWFGKVALDAEKQGWNYVLSTHAPVAGNSYAEGEKTINKIITAFNKKTSTTVNGVAYDFTNYDGQMSLNISGHTHIQSWRLLGDTMAAVNTSSGRLAYYPNESLNNGATHTDYHPVRWEGTYSEACFDAVVYDKAINTIQRFNFGNCPDDKFVITENGIEVTVTPHDGPLK